jgi:drug/metabolite transporter superfamily protein YnfA
MDVKGVCMIVLAFLNEIFGCFFGGTHEQQEKPRLPACKAEVGATVFVVVAFS